MLLAITIIILPESYLSDFCTPGSRWIPGTIHGRGRKPVPERAQLTAEPPRPKSKRWFCIAVW